MKRIFTLPFFLAVVVIACLVMYSLHLTLVVETLSQEKLDLRRDFEAAMDDLNRQIGEWERQARSGRDVEPEPAKVVYLTFDDGPSVNTELILDILEEYGIKATFFVNGSQTDFARSMYQRIAADGHALGNHGYSHDYSLIYQSVETYLYNLQKLDDLLYEATGTRPRLTRFPGGSRSGMAAKYGGSDLIDRILPEIEALGYVYFDWNIDSRDTSQRVPPVELIINSVMDGVRGRDKAVVLFHDAALKTTTVEALPTIIDNLIAQGYTFAPLSPTSFNWQFSRPR